MGAQDVEEGSVDRAWAQGQYRDTNSPSWAGRRRSDVGVDVPEQLGGVGHWLGLEAELLHDF
ncbi:MAG TPA: hypothetical protein VGI96_42530, partial [Streptosporangiaceae bacterium]